MTNELGDLKNAWQEAKKSKSAPKMYINDIINTSKKKMKSAIGMHIGTISILSVTLIALILFFKYLAPLQETLSHAGIALMIGGLIVRILIELYSIILSARINMSDTTAQNSESSLRFYQFRKTIHGPVMYTILAAYTIGFYLLTPEFSSYFSTWMMVVIDGSYIVIAGVVGYFISVGIKKEMTYLHELIQIRNDLQND